MGITLGICGVGAFSDHFIPLFKAHPEVKQVVLCDLDSAKLKHKAEQFGISATCPSLDELCQTSVDAILLFRLSNSPTSRRADARTLKCFARRFA